MCARFVLNNEWGGGIIPRKIDTIKEVTNLQKEPPDPLVIPNILYETCEVLNVSIEDVNGKSRKRKFVNARQMTCYTAIAYGFKSNQVADALNWDRSGVYNRKEKGERFAILEPAFRRDLNLILEKFGLTKF